jgi:UDP-perosamine 4-acetyltransferase
LQRSIQQYGTFKNMHKEIIVVGAGGHAKVCIELLQAMGEKISYCIGSQNESKTALFGIPVLKGDNNLHELQSKGFCRVFIAIGDNELRNKLAKLSVDIGYNLVNAISPTAVISPSARIGFGVAIMAGAIINSDCVINDLSIINTGATIDHDCHIGHSTHIAPQCALAGNVSVGDFSFVGIGTKIIPKINIGKYVIVGAGSVVITDFKTGSKAMGVPARSFKDRNKQK